MEVKYRPLELRDLSQLKTLHEDLFPVRYCDSFFQDVVAGRCVRGGLKLFTSLAIQVTSAGEEEIIGFILAQTMLSSTCDDIDSLFEQGEVPLEVCYILTLGLRRGLRRSGIGSVLLQQCIEFASQCVNCGMIYLHVISYNIPGRKFYEKNSFHHAKHNPDFYFINGQRYSSETFAKYLHQFHPPMQLRLYEFLSFQSLYLLGTLRWIEQSLFGSDSLVTWLTSSTITKAEREPDSNQDTYPYMDDITLPENGSSLKIKSRREVDDSNKAESVREKKQESYCDNI